MRELKFRQAIFHPVTGEFVRWHYWGLIDGAFVGVDTGWYSPTEAIENSYQYIGRKDENGKEIYEGGIVRTDEAEWVAQVIYHRDCFMCIGLDGKGFSVECNWENFEVIGNISENPELLEK